MKTRKRSLFGLTGAISSALVLMLGCAFLRFFWEERELVYRARITRAQADIEALVRAAELFRRDHGRYPAQLGELVRTADNPDGMLVHKIRNSPWESPFLYRLEQRAGTESVRIWTVPDRETRDRSGLAELSNETDWQALWSHQNSPIRQKDWGTRHSPGVFSVTGSTFVIH